MYLYCIVPIKFIYIAAQKYSAQPDVTGLCVLTMAGTTLWMVDSPRQVYLIKKIQFRIKGDIDWRIQNLHSSYFCLFKNIID